VGEPVRDALVLYARVPRPGEVKTRLCPWLSPAEALALHLALIEDSIDIMKSAARESGAVPLLAFSEAWEPAENGPQAPLAFAAAGLERLPQTGDDLGARLEGTFRSLLARGHRGVVIFGADSPTLAPAILVSAFAVLGRGSQVALGPAEDGGFYLIGSRLDPRGLLRGIHWGTAEVLKETLAAIERAGARATLLPEGYDIDRPEDLARARADLSGPRRVAAKKTAAFIEELVLAGRLPGRKAPRRDAR
jgi:hypothetical protein